MIIAMPKIHRPVLVVAAVLIAASVAQAQPGLTLPEPEVPPVRHIEPSGPSPTYYRIPPDLFLFSYRVNLGTSRRVNSDDGDKWAFSLQLHNGYEIAFWRGARYALLAEVGYAYSTFSEHLFSVGLGPIRRRFGPSLLGRDDGPIPGGDASISVVPHFVVGKIEGETAHGVQVSVLASLSLYGSAISYQYAVAGQQSIHAIVVEFMVNPREDL